MLCTFFNILVIGGWSDTRSTIRQGAQQDFSDFQPQNTPDLLDIGVFRQFTISWAEGRILVYKSGESQPFLDYTHATPFPINFIGFTTGFGSTGEFIFCAFGKFYEKYSNQSIYGRINVTFVLIMVMQLRYVFFSS